jgi:hypothetical protein
MTLEIMIGNRVRMSALGAERCPNLAGKYGTVVGGSVYNSSVSVRFDGKKSSITLHQSYLEVVSLQERDSSPTGNPLSTKFGPKN